MAGDADCFKCKHNLGVKYKSDALVNNKAVSFKCKARDEERSNFKGFYCWFYEKN